MTEQRAAQLIEEALHRIPNVGDVVVRRVGPLFGKRWGARVEYEDGHLRTRISFNEPAGGDDAFRAAAQYELQKYLRLCPLCQRESYVQRLDPAAAVLFVNCPSCRDYEIDG